MKVFLDTTYFFPTISVSVSTDVDNFLLKLLESEKNISIHYSILSIFELQAKGTKYVIQSKIEKEDLISGIDLISQEEKIQQVPFWEAKIITTGAKIKKIHSDYIDCILLASAIHSTDVFITEDSILKEILEKIQENEFVKEVFKIINVKDFQKQLK